MRKGAGAASRRRRKPVSEIAAGDRERSDELAAVVAQLACELGYR